MAPYEKNGCNPKHNFRSPNLPEPAAAESDGALPLFRGLCLEQTRRGGAAPAAAAAASASSRGRPLLGLRDADERLEQRLAHLHDQLGRRQHKQQQQSQQLKGKMHVS